MAHFEDEGCWSEAGLDRYVRQVEEPAILGPVGRDGLLRVGAHPSGARRVTDWPWPVTEFVGDPANVVVVAPAGGGKSTVLAALWRHEPRAVSVRLRTGYANGVVEALDAAIAGGGPVFLDALEVAWADAELWRILERQLATARARRVTWRLACRPAAWGAGLGRFLEDTLEGLEQVQLLPLGRNGVAEVAAGVGADPEAFLDAVIGARLGGLAATPRALRAAAEQWQASGRLFGDSLDAVRFVLAQWLPGQEAGRGRPSIAAERQQRIAARLGATAVFSQTQRFALSEPGEDGVVSVAELPATPEPDEPEAPVTASEYHSVLDSALFRLTGETTVAFRDRGYAEFLAAAYLVERRVDHQRLHSLLGVQADGRIPRKTVGVAAWLTALAPQLTADLVSANVVALVRVGLELPDDHVKATIAGHLLEGATQATVDAGQDVDLTPLAHAGLTDQLERCVAAGIAQPERLWWVARLAGAGGCRRLVAPLLAHALDPGWPSWARAAAVAVVAELGDPAQVQALRGLLYLDEREDPEDELLGRALTALYPDVLGTEEMLAALRPQRNPDVLGVYHWLVHDLGGTIPDHDLGLVLAWLGGRLEDSLEDFAWMADEIIERAWELWRDTGSEPLLSALAAAVCRIMTTCGLSKVLHGPAPWFQADRESRRPLALAVAERLGSTDNWSDLDLRHLVEPEDTSWLLETLPTLARPVQAPLVACLSRVAVRLSTRHDAERILTLPVDHPAYEATAHLREPCPLDPDTGLHCNLPSPPGAQRPPRFAPRHLRRTLRGWRGWRRKLTLRTLDRLAERRPAIAAAACRRLHSGHDEVATRASQLLCRLDPSVVVRDRLTTDPYESDLIQLVPLIDATRLDLREVAELSKVLLDHFPIPEIPHPSPVGFHQRGVKFQTHQARDDIRHRLVAAGDVDRLEELMTDRPETELAVLRRESRRARQVAADQALTPLEPDQLLADVSGGAGA